MRNALRSSVMPSAFKKSRDRSNRVVALFAGIGGIECGMHSAGHTTRLLCEIDSAANAVLNKHFVGVDRVLDVQQLEKLPPTETITAGFPCQDLSQAGA